MKKLWCILFSPLTVIRLILVIFVTIFFSITLAFENRYSQKKGDYLFWSFQKWAKTIIFILGYNINKNRRPCVKRYILMSNHRSYLDILIIAAYAPSAFLAKAEIQAWPAIGRLAAKVKTIFVQREELKSLLESMNKIKETVTSGISVTLFPEGTTSKGPGILPFKNGSFKIAAELSIPIIPCAIEYNDKNDAWIGDDTFFAHFFRQMWKPVSKAAIRFGQPITHADFSELKGATKSAIENMLKLLQQ